MVKIQEIFVWMIYSFFYYILSLSLSVLGDIYHCLNAGETNWQVDFIIPENYPQSLMTDDL